MLFSPVMEKKKCFTPLETYLMVITVDNGHCSEYFCRCIFILAFFDSLKEQPLFEI